MVKIITGGGGIDADGNAYTLPDIEREVPDDYFKRMFMAAKSIPKPNVMFVHPDLLASLKNE
jgi:hypothetical protein